MLIINYKKIRDELIDICKNTMADINLIIKHIDYLITIDIIIFGHLMDAYILTRMLIYNSNQVILYLGNLHIQTIVPFMRSFLKYKLKDSSFPGMGVYRRF